MEILNFIFRIGVLLAIYNFLWWLINLALSALRGGRRKMLPEAYLIKLVRYFFLVDVTFLFCLDNGLGGINFDRVLVAGLVLLIYFIGKLQSNQMRRSLLSVRGNMPGMEDMIKRMTPVFNVRYEIGVILIAVATFTLFIFYPDWASNPISNWFLASILDIEDTPVFGFIFKVIGFFFMASIIVKVTQGFLSLFIRGDVEKDSDDEDDDDHFDDFTEIK